MEPHSDRGNAPGYGNAESFDPSPVAPPKRKRGRPRKNPLPGAEQQAPVQVPGAEQQAPVQAGPVHAGQQIDLEEVQRESSGQAQPETGSQQDPVDPQIRLTPEAAKILLKYSFMGVSNGVLNYFGRENVTKEEAQEWAEATHGLYAQYFSNVDVGIGLHLAYTAGLLMGKGKKDPGGENGGK